MASKFIVVIKDGGFVEAPMRKPQALRNIRTWQHAAVETTSLQRSPYFLFRYHGCWHVWRTAPPEKLKTFVEDNRPAAEMWLYHKMGQRQI